MMFLKQSLPLRFQAKSYDEYFMDEDGYAPYVFTEFVNDENIQDIAYKINHRMWKVVSVERVCLSIEESSPKEFYKYYHALEMKTI